MDISFIIVNWNTKALLLNCLASIYQTAADMDFEVWVVDNASSDGSVAALRTIYPEIHVIENTRNLGFAAANNLAFAQMQGRYAVLINTDARLRAGAVRNLFDFMEEVSKASMACGQLLNEDGSKQNSIAPFPTPISLISNETLLRLLFPQRYPSKRKHYTAPIAVDSCIGACIMVRKSAMDQVGFLDERYFFFLEETDWAYRMKLAGWKVYFVPTAQIFHAQGKTVGGGVSARILFYRSRYQFFEKWHKKSYFLVRLFAFSRLLVNTLLNLSAVGFTFGLNKRLKEKLKIYTKLVQWHLKGCPQKKEMETAQLLKGNPALPKDDGPILLIQLGDIGDAVLTLPAIGVLGRTFPKRSLVVCVREHARELMEDCPFVHHVLSINKQRRKVPEELAHQLQFLRDLRKCRSTLTIELRTGTRGAVIALLSGARTRIARYANDGTLWRNRLFTHLVRPTRENIQYAAQHNLNIMAPFGLTEKDPRPNISVPHGRREKADAIFRKAQIPRDKAMVAVHPFSLWKYKEWRLSEMAALLDRIQTEYHCNFVITGAPNERTRAKDLIGICNRKPYNLAGETSIGELPAVLGACSLFIGVDTAALHIAAAVGIPTVGIFGPSSWTNWAPRGRNHLVVKKDLPCQPCSQKGCEGSEKSRCLDELTAREIHTMMKRILDTTLVGKSEVH